MDERTRKAKRALIIINLVSWVTLLVPVIVYNAVNWRAFERVSAMKFTFSFLIAMSMIGLAALTKRKERSGVMMLSVGVILAIMGEVATQIGYSLLMIGGAMILDQLLWKPLAFKYKEVYYAGTGRQITYTKSIE